MIGKLLTYSLRLQEYWKKTIKEQILKRFPGALAEFEQDAKYSLFKRIDVHALFTRLEVLSRANLVSGFSLCH